MDQTAGPMATIIDSTLPPPSLAVLETERWPRIEISSTVIRQWQDKKSVLLAYMAYGTLVNVVWSVKSFNNQSATIVLHNYCPGYKVELLRTQWLFNVQLLAVHCHVIPNDDVKGSRSGQGYCPPLLQEIIFLLAHEIFITMFTISRTVNFPHNYFCNPEPLHIWSQLPVARFIVDHTANFACHVPTSFAIRNPLHIRSHKAFI